PLRTVPDPRTAPARRTGGAEASLARAAWLGAAHGRQQQLHRPVLRRRRLPVLRAGRRAGAAHPGPAGPAAERDPAAGDLQPGLYHARHGDDVPVRRAGGRSAGGDAAAPDAGGARPAVPEALGLRLLGLPGRRSLLLRLDLLRPGP